MELWIDFETKHAKTILNAKIAFGGLLFVWAVVEFAFTEYLVPATWNVRKQF